MTTTWKGKKTDHLLSLLYLILYCLGVHVIIAFKQAVNQQTEFSLALRSPGNFFLTLIIVFIFMSPVWVYYRKVPKSLSIESDNRKLIVHKRRKTLRYDMDRIRFYKRLYPFFYILEIHATFQSSRRESFEKMACSIIVPNWGLSWNKRKMEEIVGTLKEQNIEEIKSRPYVPFSEYIYN